VNAAARPLADRTELAIERSTIDNVSLEEVAPGRFVRHARLRAAAAAAARAARPISTA
jgi:hypothetical protein